MKGSRARLPIAELKRRPVRLSPGVEAELRALAQSWLDNPIHDVLVRRSDNTIIDGHRRVEGLALLGVTEAEVFLVEDELSDDSLDDIAFETAWHRAPLGGFEQATLLRSKKERNPCLTNKDLASALHIDPSMVTRLLSLFDCIGPVRDAAREGKIGVSDWYAISKSDAGAQAAQLGMKLNGATRDEIEEMGRKGRSARKENGHPTVRAGKIKCPLASGQVVTVAGDSESSLEEALEALGEATKALKSAISKGLNAKTAQAVWKDLAASGG